MLVASALLTLVAVTDSSDKSSDQGIQAGFPGFPPTAVPVDKDLVLAAFDDAYSIPLTYVDDTRAAARYTAEELQAGSSGYVRVHMSISNRSDVSMSLGPEDAFGILTDGHGFNFFVYTGVRLTEPNDGLPESLAPGESWTGWVYLQAPDPRSVFFKEGAAEFVLEVSSDPNRARFRHYIPLK